MKKFMIGSLILLFLVISVPAVKAINYTLTNQDIPHNTTITGTGRNFDVSYSDTLIHKIALQADASTSFAEYDHIRMALILQRQGALWVYTDKSTATVSIYNDGVSLAVANMGEFANGKFRYKYSTIVKDGLYGNFKGTIDQYGV